jgi:hypothetical protein
VCMSLCVCGMDIGIKEALNQCMNACITIGCI